MTTGFPLAAAVSILNGLTPCVQSAKDTIPASNPQVRNGCGCAAAQARRTSTRWLISLPWQLRWPPFCTALTPTVLPNSFGVPPDLPFPYLFQVRGLPRYGFCALEMPLNSFVSHLPVCGLLLLPVLLISSATTHTTPCAGKLLILLKKAKYFRESFYCFQQRRIVVMPFIAWYNE